MCMRVRAVACVRARERESECCLTVKYRDVVGGETGEVLYIGFRA